MIKRLLEIEYYDQISKIAYIAGVIDSDGWIIIAQTESSFRIAIGIKQQKSEAIELAAELFDGTVRVITPVDSFSNKPMFSWVISDRTASETLEVLLPHLRIKKAQARLAIEYQRVVAKRLDLRGRSKLSNEEWLKRYAMFLAMKTLNGRAAATTKREGLDSKKNQVSDSLNCRDDKSAEAAEMAVRLVEIARS